MKQEVYLTIFELIHTYGFLKIMSLIWCGCLAFATPIIYFLKKTKEA